MFTISVPPLRERLQDLLPLARPFIDKATRRLGLPPISGIEPDSAERLLQYYWPGNVRELENLVERAVILDYKMCIRDRAAALMCSGVSKSGRPMLNTVSYTHLMCIGRSPSRNWKT